MDENEYWELIDAIHEEHRNDMDQKSEALKEALSHLSEREAISFSEQFEEKMDLAYNHALWGAAYLIHGGCSDDTFTDFRASLISRGKRVYENAIEDPDSLAEEEFDEDAWFYEGYQYAVAEGVEQVVGSRPPRKTPFPSEPAGEPWEESPEVFKSTYPKLWAHFGQGWEVPEVVASTNTKPWWKFWRR